MRNEAQKLESMLSRILELMQLIRRHVNYIIRLELCRSLSVENNPFPFKNEDFVFPRMCVQRAAPAFGHFEEAHRKVGGTHVFADEPANFDVAGATFGDVFSLDGFIVEHVHDCHCSKVSAIGPRLYVCAHCGCKVYEGACQETMDGEELSFCCTHFACSNRENKSIPQKDGKAKVFPHVPSVRQKFLLSRAQNGENGVLLVYYD